MAAGLVALAFYLRTVAPSLPSGDSGDLITAAWVLGIPHPPGYPLYTMLGHLFGLLPLGSPALRVNLLSAALHAATVGLTGLLIYRLLGRDDRPPPTDDRGSQVSAVGRPACPEPAEGSVVDPALAALTGALLLAFSTAFWGYALVAEVFPLNSFLAALLLLLLLEWGRRPQRLARLRAFALGCGLAASNHYTIVLLAPAFLVLLVSGARRLAGAGERAGERGSARVLRPALSRSLALSLAVAAGLLLVGLLPYLYLPLAAGQDPAYNWGDPRTAENFVRHVSRADYGTFSFSAQSESSGTASAQVGLLAAYLFHAFTPLGCLLAAAGAWWLARHRPIEALALLVAFLASGPAFVAYANPNIADAHLRGVLERFYILPSLPFALACGAGAYQLLLWARTLPLPPPQARYAAPLVALALFALPAGSALAHLGAADQSDNFVTRYFGEDLLAPIEPNALFLMRGDPVIFSVDYLQFVEGYRRDVIAVEMDKLQFPWYVREQRRHHPDLVIPFAAYDHGQATTLRSMVEVNLSNRPVYLTAVPQEKDFASGFDFVRAGFSLRLLPKGDGPDPLAIVREKTELFEQLHYPTRTYPETSFEFGLSKNYGVVAFDVGNVLREAGRPAPAVSMYRTAIRLAPDYPLPYKNLGLLLLQMGSSPAETAALWEHYLELNPGDPDAAAMRVQVDAIRGLAR